MKNIIKILSILLVLVAIGCDSNDDASRFYNEPTTGWVEFNTASASTTISTSTQSLSLPVGLRVPIYRNGINVTYSLQPVEGDLSSIVTSTETTVSFGTEPSSDEGDARVKNIDLQFDFEGFDPLVDFVVFDVVLTAVDVDGVSIGVDNNSIVSYRVSTPCPLNVSDNYNVDVSALGGVAPSHTVALTPVSGTTYSITSSWGPNFVSWATGNSAYDGQFVYPINITINPDLTLNIVSTDPSFPGGGGTGSYDSCADTFFITLTQGLFTTDFTADIVMTGM